MLQVDEGDLLVQCLVRNKTSRVPLHCVSAWDASARNASARNAEGATEKHQGSEDVSFIVEDCIPCSLSGFLLV